jgi:hypothetical protein
MIPRCVLCLALALSAGCLSIRDIDDRYPDEIRALCERANVDGKAHVAKIMGKEPRRTIGWRVALVEGVDSPYGKALRSDLSPTGWAGALTRHNNTTVVRSRANAGTLKHEAIHYWANMNDVEVGL